MRKLALGLAVVIATTTATAAADMIVDVPAPVIPPTVPAAYDWSGWYLGGYAGYLRGDFFGDVDQPGLSGLDAGAQVHYNAVMSNWVVSPFLAATLPVQKSEMAGVPISVKWAVQGGLRLGYAHDRWLPYVYGGGVVGAAHAGSFVNETHTHFGYLLGAGVEYAVDPNWTVGVRYAYYHLSPQTYDQGGADVHDGWSGHSILGTISFKIH
jgi:opacity protein-like surface antigen